MSTQTISHPHSSYPLSRSRSQAPVRRPRRGPRDERYGALSRLRAQGQEEVSGRLHGLLEALPAEVGEVYDEQEQCDRDQGHELDFALLSMRAETLRGIELALERCKRGQDTECVECGLAIEPARLQALPFAVRCRPCQEALETRARLAANASPAPALPWR